MVSVLFVCLGNICRSPLAEGVFNDLLQTKGLSGKVQCDSCGTSNYHIGEQPDPRTVANARENGVHLNHHARQFTQEDFQTFDYILTMDSSNMEHVKMKLSGSSALKAQLFLMREFDPQKGEKDVPDPYYGGPKGFQNVFDILSRSCDNFLNWLDEKHNLQ